VPAHFIIAGPPVGPEIGVLFAVGVCGRVSKQVFINPVFMVWTKVLVFDCCTCYTSSESAHQKKSCQLGRLTSNFEFLKNLSSTAILLVILSSKQTFKSAKFRKLGAGPLPWVTMGA
jgi:hypothetical protein